MIDLQLVDTFQESHDIRIDRTHVLCYELLFRIFKIGLNDLSDVPNDTVLPLIDCYLVEILRDPLLNLHEIKGLERVLLRLADHVLRVLKLLLELRFDDHTESGILLDWNLENRLFVQNIDRL